MSRHVDFLVQTPGGSVRSSVGVSHGTGSPAGSFGRLGVPSANARRFVAQGEAVADALPDCNTGAAEPAYRGR